LVTILVILVCFFLFFKFKNNKVSYSTKNQEETTKIINKEIQQTLKNDTDGDGLKDWEETLWKTDPNNPDTDNDGTDDNSEILANRNPLIAGPNDFLDNKVVVVESTQNNFELNQPLTQTDILSRELFAGYVALKQNNQLGTVQEEQFINNLITKNLSADINSIKKYTLDDLNILQDDRTEVLQQYATQLNSILNAHTDIEYDLSIVKNALETKNQGELKKLDSNIEVYKEVQKELLRIPLPYKITAPHLEMINTFADLINDIQKMKLIWDDPLIGLTGIRGYTENEETLRKELAKITQYLSAKNVITN